MNKKFITLLASALVLGGSVSTVSAADVITGVKDGQAVTISLDGDGDTFLKFNVTGTGVVSFDGTETKLTGEDVKADLETLWTIQINEPAAGVLGNPTYEFINKATGKKFAVNLADASPALYLEHGNTVWGYSDELGLYAPQGNSIFYFDGKALKKATGTYAEVIAKVTAKTIKVTNPAVVASAVGKSATLTPDGFNYLLSKTGGQMSFGNNKDVFGKDENGKDHVNQLTANKWKVRSASVLKNDEDSKYLMFTKLTDTPKDSAYVLVVDTLFYDKVSGDKYHMLKLDTLGYKYTHDADGMLHMGSATGKTKRDRLTATFKAKYFFSEDSLVINSFREPTFNGTGTVGEKIWATAGAEDGARVALQNLGGGTKVLTLADVSLIKFSDITTPAPDAKETDNKALKDANFEAPLIQPGFSATPSADNRTSVADGVYFITKTDAAGKVRYLAAPIKNTLTKTTTNDPEWIVLDSKNSQNPEDMPAYQWVVLKDVTSAAASATSSVTAYNREYPDKKASAQLFKKAGAKYMYTTTGAGIVAATDSLTLTPVSKAAVEDKKLGYKYFTQDELMANRYTFRYYHAYANDKYIAKNAKDSITAVLNGKTFFALKEVYTSDYGYKVKAADKTRIPGLAQLERTSYIPSIKAGGATKDLYFDVDKDKQMVLSQYMADGSGDAAPQDSFYFKTNNEYPLGVDGAIIDYHALVNLNDNDKTTPKVINPTKAGVTENDPEALLKDQAIDAVYTSVFYIAPADAPLYRRFNSVLEGAATDAVDTLRFVEKYRGEYLQREVNPSFTEAEKKGAPMGIDFAGIYTAEYASNNTSFIVDSVWINRGQGKIKPQYLVSVDREDVKAKLCPECQALVDAGQTRPAALGKCIHDKVAFKFGYYLVSFADSTSADYDWKMYDRVGFVKAAVLGDATGDTAMFILEDKPFEKTTAKNFNYYSAKETLEKSYTNRIVDLRGDKHKSVTWSFRYMTPEKIGDTEDSRSFLFESKKNDGDLDIAPSQAQWLKIQNGCLVLSDPETSKFETMTFGDDAAVFNIEKGAAGEMVVTDNDAIATTEFAVVAVDGGVQVLNAAGKTVVITNILGQAVVNTVVTSDNATIAVPAGIVVVAVEGEEAVKAIVK